jgi:hypothetical protein
MNESVGSDKLCWPSPAQSVLVPGPAGLMTIFFCITTLEVAQLGPEWMEFYLLSIYTSSWRFTFVIRLYFITAWYYCCSCILTCATLSNDFHLKLYIIIIIIIIIKIENFIYILMKTKYVTNILQINKIATHYHILGVSLWPGRVSVSQRKEVSFSRHYRSDTLSTGNPNINIKPL